MNAVDRAKMNQERARKATVRARRIQDDAWAAWQRASRDFQQAICLLTDADTALRQAYRDVVDAEEKKLEVAE